MTPLQAIAHCRAVLRTGHAACLVAVQATAGSVPRTAGAWMAVWAGGAAGTIGGGRLEFEAIADGRAWLAAQAGSNSAAEVGQPGQGAALLRDYPLGPALGQCCGGRVQLAFSRLDAAALARLEARALAELAPVALFGGGHVGRALAQLLTTLPLRVHWIDSRASHEVGPGASADATLDEVAGEEGDAHWLRRPNLRIEQSEPVQDAVASLAAGSRVLVMSYSHAEDFEIVRACLERRRARADLPFIGLIGSRTKWATFASRLRQRGYAPPEIGAITCPIGLPGIAGKQPEVIAVAVAAQLLRGLPGGG
ncbi:MAG: xanthine dehydrogenase accessory protein XdhC [Comamonas sp.]